MAQADVSIIIPKMLTKIKLVEIQLVLIRDIEYLLEISSIN
jgi:hypothetical protein